MLRTTLAAVLGRLAGGVVLILMLTFLAYFVFAAIPVDPAAYAVPADAPAEARAQAREQLGLDRPIVEQWGAFVWSLGTQASLGDNLALAGHPREPVNAILARSIPATASLAAGGFAIALLLATPLGVISALRLGRPVDRLILGFTVVGVVLHPFVVGLVLKGVVAGRWGLAPDGGYCPLSGKNLHFTEEGERVVCGGPGDWLSHSWLPWLTFALFFVPIYTRVIRAAVATTLGEPYVRTARAKGVSERRIVTGHVGRNAAGPVIALLAVDLGAIVVAAIYVETVFGLDGIGLLVARNLSGAEGYDRNVLVGVVVLVALTITLANLLADLAMRALDPRARAERGVL